MNSHRIHDRQPAELQAPIHIAPDRYVTIHLYAAISGMRVEAIRMKIKVRKWLESREYIRSPDGGIFIDREGIARLPRSR